MTSQAVAFTSHSFLVRFSNLVRYFQNVKICTLGKRCFNKTKHLAKISVPPHTSLCIQFRDKEDNGENNRLPLGQRLCSAIVWVKPKFSNICDKITWCKVFFDIAQKWYVSANGLRY